MKTPERMEVFMPSSLTVLCPFCGEDDFDLIGLKSHLQHDCTEYQVVETLPRIFHEAT